MLKDLCVTGFIYLFFSVTPSSAQVKGSKKKEVSIFLLIK